MPEWRKEIQRKNASKGWETRRKRYGENGRKK